MPPVPNKEISSSTEEIIANNRNLIKKIVDKAVLSTSTEQNSILEDYDSMINMIKTDRIFQPFKIGRKIRMLNPEKKSYLKKYLLENIMPEYGDVFSMYKNRPKFISLPKPTSAIPFYVRGKQKQHKPSTEKKFSILLPPESSDNWIETSELAYYTNGAYEAIKTKAFNQADFVSGWNNTNTQEIEGYTEQMTPDAMKTLLISLYQDGKLSKAGALTRLIETKTQGGKATVIVQNKAVVEGDVEKMINHHQDILSDRKEQYIKVLTLNQKNAISSNQGQALEHQLGRLPDNYMNMSIGELYDLYIENNGDTAQRGFAPQELEKIAQQIRARWSRYIKVPGYSPNMPFNKAMAIFHGLDDGSLATKEQREVLVYLLEKRAESNKGNTNLIDFETAITSIEGQLVGGDNSDKKVLSGLPETAFLAKQARKSTKRLYQENNLSEESTRILVESVEQQSDGTYSVPVLDEETQVVTKLSTQDKTFLKLKNHLAAGTGLSTFFMMKILFSPEESYEGSPMNVVSKSLSKAILYQYYFNMAGLSMGVATDVTAAYSMLAYLRASAKYLSTQQHQALTEVVAETSLDTFTTTIQEVRVETRSLGSTLPKLSPILNSATKALPRIGIGLGVVSTGFDMYKLVHAENKEQREIYGINTATDVSILGLTIAGEIVAAPIALPLYAFATVIGVVGSAISTALVEHNNIKAFIKDRIAGYFNSVEDAYQTGYTYDSSHQALSFKQGAVIKKLNFEIGEITFDSQYIFGRDPDSKYKVSSRNATSLREAFQGKETMSLNAEAQRAPIVVLPDTPKSYISYNLAMIEGVFEYGDDIYKSIRKIERASNGSFDLEYIILFFDSIVCKLFHLYESTRVDIELSSIAANQTFITPTTLPTQTAKLLDKNFQRHYRKTDNVKDLDNASFNNHTFINHPHAISYHIKGKGGNYHIVLGNGALFQLDTAGTKSSKWVINTSQLEKDHIEIKGYNWLKIGGVNIYISSESNAKDLVTVLKHNGDVCSIDLSNKKTHVIQIDTALWKSKNPNTSLEKHLQDLAQAGQLLEEGYTLLTNYLDSKYTYQARYDSAYKDIFIQKLNTTGDVSAIMMDQEWLAKRSNNWSAALKKIAGELHIELLGLPQQTWYYQEKLIVAPSLAGQNLELLGLNHESTYAYLFDSSKGILYLQAIPSAEETSHIFQDKTKFDTDHIEPAVAILSSYKLKSAENIEGMLRLVTDEGLILTLEDENKPLMLIGVNQQWQSTHKDSLGKQLDQLTQSQHWTCGDALALQGDATSIPTWYHFGLQMKLETAGLTPADYPQYIGIKQTGENLAAYFETGKGLYCYNYKKDQKINQETLEQTVVRLDTALWQNGTEKADTLNALTLEGIKFILMSAGEGKDTYQISLDKKAEAKDFSINNFSEDKLEDILKLQVDKTDGVLIKRQQNNLILSNTEGSIQFENAFADNQANYNHLLIQMADATHEANYTLDRITQKLNELAPLPIESTNQLYPGYFLNAILPNN